MGDELLQEVEIDDIARYYSLLYNQQVALECEMLRWQAALVFQIELAMPPLIADYTVP